MHKSRKNAQDNLISLSLYLFAKGYAVFAADVRIAPRHDRQCSLYAQLYIYCK